MKRLNPNSSIVHIVILIIIASFMIAPIGCTKKEENVIKIGAILPLTGDAAEWGNNTKNGIDLAVEKINNSGGINGKIIKILYEDTQGSPEKGVAAIQKLINVEKVQAVIDDSMSSVTLAMAPIAEQNKVVLLSTGATAPKISQAGNYIFRIWNSDDLEGRVSAEFVYKTLAKKNAIILYVNNDYGLGLEGVFKSEFKRLGGNILLSENFGQSDTNYKSQLSKIKQLKPDVIYLVGYPKEIALILKQSYELGIKSRFIGTVTFEDPNIIKLGGATTEGVLYPYPVAPNKDDVAVSGFLSSYKTKYKKDPGITSDVGYDAVNMIVEAMKLSKGLRGVDIQQGLMMINDYHGASGVMTFDKNGDVNKPIKMKTILKGIPIWN